MKEEARMKRTFIKALVSIAIVIVTLVFTVLPSFAAAYSSYTYSIDGTQLASPNAYEPDKIYKSADMDVTVNTGYELEDPRDVTVDDDGNVYILDVVDVEDAATPTKLCRLIVLDPYFKYLSHIDYFTNESGSRDTFKSASGVSVTDKYVYVADTDNMRIVIFEREDVITRRTFRMEDGQDNIAVYRILGKPQAEIFGSDEQYTPVAVASNDNHIYVVSSSTYMGIVSMNMEGEFQGFVGAQKVSVSALTLIWNNLFSTEEQRQLRAKYVPTEYNNLVMDEKGFIYATIIIPDKAAQQNAIKNKSASAEFAPVKKLNTNGDDILSRTGFFPPSGEVLVVNSSTDSSQPTGPSDIIDVAVGPEGTWSIIDRKRQRIFTYDKNGNLLFAFGDKGKQLGNLENITAITYQRVFVEDGLTHNMIILDKGSKSITVYGRTDYGDLLIKALKADNNREYDEAVGHYQQILSRNNNFDTAYIGMAKSLYRDGDYNGAMEQYSYAYNTAGYSQAFKMFRKDWVSKYIWVIPIVVVAVVAGLYFFFKYARKVNDKTAITSGKRTFVQEILFAFHLIFHPFDGFWDLKHEKRGSVRGSAFWLGIAVLVFTYQSIGRSYMYNPRGTYSSVWVQLASVLAPVALFTVANWCITTLFDGEGSIKDIIIATGYSLAPLPLMIIPATLLTHILASSESGIINLLNSLAFVWVGLLLFFGIMITHDYPMLKNLVTVLVTIVGMAIIMFIIILFVTLVSDMVGLVDNIWTEISYRM